MARLYGNNIPSFEDIDKIENKVLFETKAGNRYEEKIQEFFFDQFAYYPLKWTSKASQKDKDELQESKTSWKTYFKSIYLESRDTYSLMFGDQEKKIFQMLLGLELTYPINRLIVKKELLEYDNAKNKSLKSTEENKNSKDISDLRSRAEEIEKQLNQSDRQNQITVNTNALYDEYNRITNEIKSFYAKELSVENDIQGNRKKVNFLGAQIDLNQAELGKISKEIETIRKRIGDLKEFIEIGIFFSNLDIKHCPSCNHSVPESKKRSRIENKSCSLCNESVVESENSINSEAFEEKIKNLELAHKKLTEEKILTQEKIEVIRKDYETTNSVLQKLDKEQKLIGSVTPLKNRLAIIETNINKEKMKVSPIDAEREKLISELAVLNFRLKQFDLPLVNKKTITENQIDVLENAIEELNNYRFSLSENILSRLSELMLSEINGFGLNSITDIKINDNFDILFLQDGDFISFDKIAEGEQLRAKLAFYLSLIQLEVEKKVGRHSKLLIIDSPAKEEGDSKFLDGLSEVLKSIDMRFGDKLQILIGTAERKT